MTALDPRLVPVRSVGIDTPACRFALGPADRVMVVVGDRVGPGDPLIERIRDLGLVRVAPGPDLTPGQPVDPLTLPGRAHGAHRTRAVDRAVVLSTTAAGAFVCVGRLGTMFDAPVGGTVETIDAGAVVLRADGFGLATVLAWGSPVRGRLLLPASSPDGELRAGQIDVGAAGAILVAGSRIDIEALTRARALGVRGVICGGIMGKELAQLASSEARQLASPHPLAPFGLAVIDGYGRRPIPSPIWRALAAAAGEDAAIVGSPPMILIGRRPPSPWPEDVSGSVRVTAGRQHGRQGTVVEMRGGVRGEGGAYLSAALVALGGDARGGARGDRPELRVLPLADLERLD